MPEEWNATLRYKKRQQLPKKILITRNIRHHMSNQTTIRASLWVPDTPYSKMEPKIGLTLSLAGNYIRLVLDNSEEMKRVFGELNVFILDNLDKVDDAQKEALMEWQRLREKVLLASGEDRATQGCDLSASEDSSIQREGERGRRKSPSLSPTLSERRKKSDKPKKK